MLSWMMDRPTLVCWLFACILGFGYIASTRVGREFMPPLDEGTLMDMPTTVPRVSVTQAAADLRARDAVLRTFPEVLSVVGKAGRAETPTDPAPLDMVETVINLRDRGLWPKRQVPYADVVAQTSAALDSLIGRGFVKAPATADDRSSLVNDAAMVVATRVDEALRGHAQRRLAEFRPELGRALVGEAVDEILRRVDRAAVLRPLKTSERGPLLDALSATYADRLALEPLYDDVAALARDASRRLVALGVLADRTDLLAPPPTLIESAEATIGGLIGSDPPTLLTRLTDKMTAEHERRFRDRVKSLNWELFDEAVRVATRSALDEVSARAAGHKLAAKSAATDDLRALATALDKPFDRRLLLWPKTKKELIQEMDSALQVPGWGNIWTQPIINRIEMLSTGVRTDIGVKVFGDNLDQIQRVSQEVAGVLKGVKGAVDVFPDQVVGKGYVEIHIDRERAARYGVQVGDVQDVVEVAIGGKPLTVTVEKRERYPVRVRYARDFRGDEEDLKQVLVTARGPAAADAAGAMGGMAGPAASPGKAGSTAPAQVPLSMVADVKVVEGPSMIKSENGLLRSYIQLNVRDRDEVGFVEEARRAVAEKVKLPTGVYLEWTGQFEHQLRARRTLQVVFPAVVAVIVLLLYLTYKSWVDAALMMTSVLGALAGGAIFQWLFGFNFSVAVWVGYIACFGMAVETGVVMLVYLREAVDSRGGLAAIASEAELRAAVLDGAIHRLRPKLLTEGTTIISIAPMLWATGVGAEVIRPMAAPVLGGLLIADEVIDIFLPVLFFAVEKWRWRALRRAASHRPPPHLPTGPALTAPLPSETV
jgi:Cu(I)/Ag(I) efflux system membrane protein CusA/SilA